MPFCLARSAWHDEACKQPLCRAEAPGHECVVPVPPLDDDCARFDNDAEVVVT